MTDFNPTGRWRHRAELVDGNERLILQIEERDSQSDSLYGRNLAKVQWRDAKTTDLAIPLPLDPSRCGVCGAHHRPNMPCQHLQSIGSL